MILFRVVGPPRSTVKQVQRTLPPSTVAHMQRKRARSTLPGLLMQATVGETEAVNPLLSSSGSVHGVARHRTSLPLTECNDKAPADKDANLYTLEFVLSSSVAKSTDHVRKLLAFE